MSEHAYEAAKAKLHAAEEELLAIRNRFSGDSRQVAVAINRAELHAHQKKLNALLEMQATDTQPNSPFFPGSPYTRAQVHQADIAQIREEIAKNRRNIEHYMALIERDS
jgi:hypothetical protein